MELLTFNQEANRLLPETTQAEREHMRRYNWLVREIHPTTVKAEFATVWDQIGRWPANREVEWTIPQVHFTQGTEIIQLPLCLQHIVAQEALSKRCELASSPTENGTRLSSQW